MRVSLGVFGVFHHFELARELDRRGHFDTIYSTWPWARLKREGLPHSKVRTFPWYHTPEYLLARAGLLAPWLADLLRYQNALRFDDWTNRRIGEIDAFVAISGAGLKTGRALQQRGGIYICDRGSSHAAYQEEIVADEFRRWGQQFSPGDPRAILREETIYQAADAITVPSSFARRSFIERGLPEEKVHTIPYGVRLESFSRVAEPSTGKLEVLFVGHVSLRKGVPYLLQAFAALKHPHKRLRVVGPMAQGIESVLSRLPQEHVEFLGALPQSRLPQIMSESHMLVLPSIEEGLALVQAQALACGCPVLGTTNSGAEDLLTDGVEGFVLPIRDVAALTARMLLLAEDPALQHRMSEAALARVQHLGGWRQYGDQWEALLRGLIRT